MMFSNTLLYYTLSRTLNWTINPVFVREEGWRAAFYPPGLGSGSLGRIDGQRRLAEAWVWVIARNPEGKGIHLALARRHLGLDRNQRGPGAAGRAVSPLWGTQPAEDHETLNRKLHWRTSTDKQTVPKCILNHRTINKTLKCAHLCSSAHIPHKPLAIF